MHVKHAASLKLKHAALFLIMQLVLTTTTTTNNNNNNFIIIYTKKYTFAPQIARKLVMAGQTGTRTTLTKTSYLVQGLVHDIPSQ